MILSLFSLHGNGRNTESELLRVPESLTFDSLSVERMLASTDGAKSSRTPSRSLIEALLTGFSKESSPGRLSLSITASEHSTPSLVSSSTVLQTATMPLVSRAVTMPMWTSMAFEITNPVISTFSSMGSRSATSILRIRSPAGSKLLLLFACLVD